MRVLAIVSAAVLALAATGCGSDDKPAGNHGGSGGIDGNGGTGGTGGTGGVGGTGGTAGAGGEGGTGGTTQPDPRGEACATYCGAIDACGFLADGEYELCMDDCTSDDANSTELYAECGACFAQAECADLESGAACEAECTGGLDLTLIGTGLAPWTGSELFVNVHDGAGTQLAGDHWVIGDGGQVDFEIPLIGFFEAGDTIVVDWFVDLNADGICGDGDHAGRVESVNAQDHVTVTISPSVASDTSVCEDLVFPVDLNIDGTGFGAYAGKDLNISVVDSSGAIVTSGAVTLEETSFPLLIADALTLGETYTVSYFVDLDGNFSCDATDVVGSVPVAAVTGNTTVTIDAEVSDGEFCADFDWMPKNLVLDGTGFEAANGGTVAAVVSGYFDLFGMWFPLDQATATVVDGAFHVVVPGVLDDSWTAYQVEWFVDADGDDLCGGADLGGTLTGIAPPFAGDVVRALAPADAGTLTCESFPDFQPGVAVTGTGFSAREGEYFDVYLVDLANPTVHVSHVDGEITAGGFEVRLPGAVAGHSYEVLWFVAGDYLSEEDIWCDLPDDMAGRIEVGAVTGVANVSVSPVATSDAEACTQMNAFWE